MSRFSNLERRGRRIIIEGPDSVGKDTFIAGFQDFLNGVDRFDGANMHMVEVPCLRVHATGETLTGEAMQAFRQSTALLGRDVLDVAEEDTTTVRTARYADTISHRAIHSKDSSPEAAQFLAALDKGEITDQRAIAEEYLQIHFDLENLAQDLEEVHDAVIMNRSLISYHAMQISALGFGDLLDKWTKLWNYSRQSEALFVRLTAPRDVVQARLAARQQGDFRGEVENYYMQRWDDIQKGFVDFQASGRCRVSMAVDTSQPVTDHYRALSEWIILGQISDSIAAGAGTTLSDLR